MQESYVYISYKKEKEAASSRGEKEKKGEIARETQPKIIGRIDVDWLNQCRFD